MPHHLDFADDVILLCLTLHQARAALYRLEAAALSYILDSRSTRDATKRNTSRSGQSETMRSSTLSRWLMADPCHDSTVAVKNLWTDDEIIFLRSERNKPARPALTPIRVGPVKFFPTSPISSSKLFPQIESSSGFWKATLYCLFVMRSRATCGSVFRSEACRLETFSCIQ
eukprot:gnl/Spiro4/22490_TR11096_c0_g2_i1.p2 gnl/Spiro4/22490_TR11096_c0_g2~~gnl/Spiro4/22490_TR11096_c0_g2_i1.p2  ORF type:complete len:171 (+),score=13.18 gnl/Spiro4/22490_TR11096_c0_g2_i1:830-1342(+)